MGKKMSREEAEKLADELLAQQPRLRDLRLVKALPIIRRLLTFQPLRYYDEPNPFVSPAAPAWEVMHRDTDTSK